MNGGNMALNLGNMDNRKPRKYHKKRGQDEADYGLTRFNYMKRNKNKSEGTSDQDSSYRGLENIQNGREIRPDDNLFIDDNSEEEQRVISRSVKQWPPNYGWCDVATTVVSIILFIVDVVFNFKLMIGYKTTDRSDLFWWTLGFTGVPSIASGIVSIVWTIIDKRENPKLYSNVTRLARVFFTFVRFGRAFRYLEFLYYVIKSQRIKSSKKKEEMLIRANDQNRDTAILGLMEGFLESALLLMLQLSITILFSLKLDFLRAGTLLTSWLSTSVTLSVFYYTTRRADPDASDVTIKAFPVYCFWRLCELGPRFVLLALGVAFLPFWFYVAVGFHFLLAFIMHIISKPKLEGVCLLYMRIPFLFLVSFISVFCFINLKKGQTWKRMITYYIVYYIENFVVMGIILGLSPDVWYCHDPYRWHCAAYALLPCALLHLIFQCLYYCSCHPYLKPVKCSLKRCCLE